MATHTLTLELPSSPVLASTKAINKGLLKIGKTADKVDKKLGALGSGTSKRLKALGKSAGAASGKVKKLGDSAGTASGKTRILGESAGVAAGKAKRLGNSAGVAGKKVAASGSLFEGLGRKVRSMAAGLLIATTAFFGIGAAIRELGAGVRAAVTIEAAGKALEVVTGSAVGSAEALRFVRMEADRLGLSIGPTASEFAKFSAAAIGSKLAGEAVRDVFSAVSEAGAKLSLSSEQQAGALLALGQIMSKGTVQAEELRGQLGERIPGAFNIMARGLDVTTAKLGKMLEAGEVLAEVALPAFAAELRRTFGTDATTRIDTAAAGLARYETAVFDAQAVLGKAFLPALGDVTTQIAAFLKENEGAIRTVGQWSGTALKAVVTFGTGASKAIGVVVEGYSSLIELVQELGLLTVEQSNRGGLFDQFKELGGITGTIEALRFFALEAIASVVQFVGEAVGGIQTLVGGGLEAFSDLLRAAGELTRSKVLIEQADRVDAIGKSYKDLAIDSSIAAQKSADGFRDMAIESNQAHNRIVADAKREVDALNEVAAAVGNVGAALRGLGGFDLVPATLNIPDRLLPDRQALGGLGPDQPGPVNPLLQLGEEFQAQLKGQSEDTKKFIADLEKGRKEREAAEKRMVESSDGVDPTSPSQV